MATQPTFLDFLNSVPAPLTTALVSLAPQISRTRRWGQTLSWKNKGYDSWLVLFAWWALCLLLDPILRYGLPIFLGLFILVQSRRPRAAPSIVTEETLQACVADLNIIHSLLPHLPRPTSPPSPKLIFRISAGITPVFLIATYFVRLRVLVAVFGTVVLTYRAQWARTIRVSLASSAHLRWIAYRTWSVLSGTPLPPPIVQLATTNLAVAAGADTAKSVRFLFTVHENQRWWMGLDWTAALLPNERPAWCSTTQAPLPSPNTFTLPEDTTVYLPIPNDPTKRVKRTARWSWEEPEWKVLVRAEGGDVSRVERSVPKDKEEPSGSRLLKAAHKMREASAEVPTTPAPMAETDVGELVTDVDGWLYGDNKWETQSSKGGMGKYTRHRRWTRVAVISETVHIVDASEAPASPTTEAASTRGRAASVVSGKPTNESHSAVVSPVGSLAVKPEAMDDGSRLRQRLKWALHASSAGHADSASASGSVEMKRQTTV